MPQRRADSLVILDFETTGLSPDRGDRAIEIGAVRIQEGKVVDTFSELMNPGGRINSFIEQYTGITNPMLARAKPCKDIMQEFANFIGDDNLIAHNASFDKRFLDAEFERINHQYYGGFSCSLLLSRRINQDAPSHKLGALIEYKAIPSDGDFHRALFDTQMTTKLWLAMLDDIYQRTGLDSLSFAQIQQICKQPKKNVEKFLNKLSNAS